MKKQLIVLVAFRCIQYFYIATSVTVSLQRRIIIAAVRIIFKGTSYLKTVLCCPRNLRNRNLHTNQIN